ncbi:hypothetical protein C4E24_06970 [ANME-1 cluster archaeon AG-394-G21]|nr:hypothetical protein [ANME-1 cluster archaeon AG-394-G21]
MKCKATGKLIIETCHKDLSNCPNVLIPTAKREHALLKWAEEADLSKRLRQRVKSKKIVHLFTIHISVSGCPNCCSRPQIADFWIRTILITAS